MLWFIVCHFFGDISPLWFVSCLSYTALDLGFLLGGQSWSTQPCKCHNLSLLNVLNEMNPFSPKKPFSSGCQAKSQWPNSWRTSRFLHTGDYWSRTLGKLVFSEWCLQAYTQYFTIDRKKDFVHHNYRKSSFAGHCKPFCFSLVAGCFWTWCAMDWWHAWSC